MKVANEITRSHIGIGVRSLMQGHRFPMFHRGHLWKARGGTQRRRCRRQERSRLHRLALWRCQLCELLHSLRAWTPRSREISALGPCEHAKATNITQQRNIFRIMHDTLREMECVHVIFFAFSCLHSLRWRRRAHLRR